MAAILGDMIQAVRSMGAIQGNLLPTKPAPKPTFANVSYAGIAAHNPKQSLSAAKNPKRTVKHNVDSDMDIEHADLDVDTQTKTDDEKYFRFKDAVKQA